MSGTSSFQKTKMRSQAKFTPYSGYLMGLPTNNKHLVFRWVRDDCKVLFSVCRKGDAASVHIASDKAGLRQLKKAINEWCEFLFWAFDWCRMVIAHIGRGSITRLVKKCGFEFAGTTDKGEIYTRLR